MENKNLQAFDRLLHIMNELREKCPWDKKQTFESLRSNTIEETYELCDALLGNDMQVIKKELGDLLLHVVFYAKIASETADFDISDVCNALCDKLIYRHPHIFGDVSVSNSEQVMENWEMLKLKEKDGNKSVLSGVPSSLPALVKAQRIQEKARSAGFDWKDKEQVWDKVKEELGELQAEINTRNEAEMEAEFGDLLFSIVNAGRLYGINPETALERTNRKFISRFNLMEQKVNAHGLSLKAMSLAEMDSLWEEAKEELKKG